jgi:hypothetical protein
MKILSPLAARPRRIVAATIAVAALGALGVTMAFASTAAGTTGGENGGKSSETFAAKVEACRDALKAGEHGLGACVSAAAHAKQDKTAGATKSARSTEDKDKDRDDRGGVATEGASDQTHGKAALHRNPEAAGHGAGSTQTEGKSDSTHGKH